MPRFASLYELPYYAAIFTSLRHGDDAGYSETALNLEKRAATLPGFLGIESARDETGFGISVSYWTDEAALKSWKSDAEHMLAQKLGKTRWYTRYSLRIAVVGRNHEGPENR
ncbi:MAG: antibiotic biosynthesis monooxygenase family protein [Paracoccaceae bacterium]